MWSDAKGIELGLDRENVAFRAIKERRLEELEVKCHQGTKVCEYVPFYFCSRSIMLYILYKGNHPDITYKGGQEPILHLQADLKATIQWAEKNEIRWAFSDRNAGAYFAKFYKSTDDLGRVNWASVKATDFRSMLVKEGKQAEFLIYKSFPLELIEKIGVYDNRIREEVIQKAGELRSGIVTVEKSWY